MHVEFSRKVSMRYNMHFARRGFSDKESVIYFDKIRNNDVTPFTLPSHFLDFSAVPLFQSFIGWLSKMGIVFNGFLHSMNCIGNNFSHLMSLSTKRNIKFAKGNLKTLVFAIIVLPPHRMFAIE